MCVRYVGKERNVGGYSIFFFKQKTAYEIGTGDWSSDVCSSDLSLRQHPTFYTAPVLVAAAANRPPVEAPDRSSIDG